MLTKSVAFFARRVVQSKLDFLRTRCLTVRQANRIVGQLNSASPQVVATEWEVIVTSAVAQHAQVAYEPLIGSARPDLCVSRAAAHAGVEFVADVTAISDRGVDERNPIDFLHEEVVMMAVKRDIDPNALSWHVGDRLDGEFSDRTVKLLLPTKRDLHTLLQTSVRPFLDRVRSAPGEPAEIAWSGNDVDFALGYQPQGRSLARRGHLALVPYSKTRNPLYVALERKAIALSKTAYRGVRGIIVGDAGSSSLQHSYGGSSSFDANDIIREFLNRFGSVHFVTASRYEYQSGYMAERGHFLRHKLYFQPDLSTVERERYLRFFNDVFGDVPRPIDSPANAMRVVTRRQELSRRAWIGAYKWSPPRKLSIPVRVFLGLVAGTLTKRIFDLLFWRTTPPNGGPLIAFFSHLLTHQIPITAVEVEHCPTEDNDWITFDTHSKLGHAPSKTPTPAPTCELPLVQLIRFFAGVDYRMEGGKPNHSFLATIPAAEQTLLHAFLSEGRLLDSAAIGMRGDTIVLSFGDRDAAVSPYW